MKLDSAEIKNNILTFTLKDSNVKFANLLRRTIMSNISILAINKVTFYDNSSTLFDEYIAHRIGLVPLVTPAKDSKEEYMFVLDEKGPKKVYSGDLKPVDHSITPAIEDIPIITLLEDQSLRLEAKAVSGLGKTHAKFQAGFSTYNINDKTGDIKFKVVSFHQMPAKELVSRALKVIDKDLTTLEKAVSKIK